MNKIILIILWFKFVSWFKSNLRDILRSINICKSQVDFATSKQKGKVHSARPTRKEEGGEKPAAYATAAEQNESISHYGKKTRAAGT